MEERIDYDYEDDGDYESEEEDKGEDEDKDDSSGPRFLIRNPLPQRDLRRFGDHLGDARQNGLQIRFLQMPVEVLLACPVLVEHEQGRTVHSLVQIVVEAARVLAARRDQRQQLPAHLRFPARLGFHMGDDCKRFDVHEPHHCRGTRRLQPSTWALYS